MTAPCWKCGAPVNAGHSEPTCSPQCEAARQTARMLDGFFDGSGSGVRLRRNSKGYLVASHLCDVEDEST